MLGDRSQALSSLGEGFKRGPVRTAWPKIRGLVAEKLDAALDVDLFDVLADLWTSQADIDLGAKGRGVEMSGVVTLGEHKVSVTLDPDLALTVDGVAAGRIGLALSFEITVKGAILTIRNNALCEAELGPVEIEARLECNGADLPLSVDVGKFDALGKHEFHPPLRLRRASAASTGHQA
ncbi:MAG TPA: hypothetical protein VGF77_10840 [Allosphingosinicella sp.]